MSDQDTIAALSRDLAIERAMRGLKVKAGAEDIARLAIEREVNAQYAEFPLSFNPGCQDMLKAVTDAALTKCPALFDAPDKGGAGSGAGGEMQARAVELKRKGIL
jgi:hypothetical protein